ncbi:MAG TPA: hypothetical protein VGE51_07345 [Fontimonas sp.]
MSYLRKCLSWAVLSLSMLATPAIAADALKSEAEVDAYVRRVMQAVGRGDLGAAYTAMKAYSVLPPSEIEAGVQATRQQRTPEFLARYGKTIGFDYIGSKKLGETMIRITYVERATNQPLPWIFYFYLNDRGWVLNQFGWSDQSAALFVQD